VGRDIGGVHGLFMTFRFLVSSSVNLTVTEPYYRGLANTRERAACLTIVESNVHCTWLPFIITQKNKYDIHIWQKLLSKIYFNK
jgi:hypothetical protein